MTWEYRGHKELQGVTRDSTGLQRVTGGYKGLQVVTRDDKELQGVTGGYKGLQGVRGAHNWLQRIIETFF